MAISSDNTLDFSNLDNTFDQQPQVFQAQGQSSIDLPSADFTTNAEMVKDGQDLILEAPDGSSVIIEGYFSTSPAPVLNAPNGTALTENLVDSFAKAPAEFAQNGTMSDVSPVGAVNELDGSATVTRTDGSVEPLQMGSPIYEGDVVETSADGAVNIVFIDETSFAVSENARMAIDEYVYDPSTESGTQNFSVLRGVFVFTSGLIGRDDPDDVEIDTPVGSIGIRGTIIAGDIDPDGDSSITVVEGAIVVKNGAGEAILSQQYDTVRITGFNNEISQTGPLDSGQVSKTYNAVKTVSPTLFSTIEDTGGSDNVNRTQTESEQDSDTNSPQQDGEATGESIELEGEDKEPVTEETTGEDQTLLNKIQDTQETFDGETRTFDGENIELAKYLDGDTTTLTREQLKQQLIYEAKVDALSESTGTADGTSEGSKDTNYEVLNPIVLEPREPIINDPRNLNNADAPGVTVISDSGIGNRIGSTVTSGFFNADGLSDIYFGNDTNNQTTYQHHNYFVNGAAAGLDQNVSGLVSAYGTPPAGGQDYSGDVLANIGDIDGDGRDDFAQGFSHSNGGGVFEGQVNIYKSSAADTNYTGTTGEKLGNSISTLGDINRDGLDDFMVGAENARKVYIGTSGSGFIYNSGNLNGDGTTGFGTSVASGDFNGDGKMDAAVSSGSTGKVYFSYGDGAGGFTWAPGSDFVASVAGDNAIHSLGDVNGDGKTDLLTLSASGQASILSHNGTTMVSASETAFGTINIIGAGAAGDWNGDGYDDFVLVTQSADNPDIALFHMMYGSAGFSGTITATDLANAYTMRLKMVGHLSADGLEYNIASAGDLNGDGLDDLVIGTPDYGFDLLAGDANNDGISINDNDGRVTIVLGRDTDSNDILAAHNDHNTPATANADGQTLRGTSGYNTFHDGDDTNPYGNLSINSGAGNDFFGLDVRKIATDRIDGGSGIDTIVLKDPSNSTDGGIPANALDFSTIQNIDGIEEFWLREDDMSIKLTVDDLFRLFEQSDTNEITFDVGSSNPTGTTIYLDTSGAITGSGLSNFRAGISAVSGKTSTLDFDATGSTNANHDIAIDNNTLYIDESINLVVI